MRAAKLGSAEPTHSVVVLAMALSTLQSKNSFYTLTARDNTGVIHALKKFSLASLPQQCSGFEVLD